MTQSSSGLQDMFVESTAPDLQSRVQMACAKLSQNIATEPTDTPNHAARNMLAQQIARSPQMFSQPFTTMICAQGITRSSPDSDIENMISACWNTMAGGTA